MPYKNSLDQFLASRRWYVKNSAAVIARKQLRRKAKRMRTTAAEVLRTTRRSIEDERNAHVLSNPRGKVCLVGQCSDCWRFCQLEPAAPGLRYINKFSDQCLDCERNESTFSPVASCDACGMFKIKAVFGVCLRHGLYDDPMSPTPCLCVGCWNKAKAIHNRMMENIVQRRFINRTIREIKDVEKNGIHRPDQGVPYQHDGRS